MNLKKTLLKAQKSEITEYHIYKKLAKINPKNSKVLNHISEDELKHYNVWKKHTKEDVEPDKFKIWWYCLVSRIFGLTFGVRLMEKGEKSAQVHYDKIPLPEAKTVIKEEEQHEQELIGLIDEEKLKYVGSMVLGLNDALVELTGALAGFTFALQKTNLIAVTGLITGLAASLSMGASEYLATKTDGNSKHPFKASLYTGTAYVFTVILLISPYFLVSNVYLALGTAIGIALLIILVFNFYISVAKNCSFKKRFAEMALISLGVAAISFGIGYLIKTFLGVDL